MRLCEGLDSRGPANVDLKTLLQILSKTNKNIDKEPQSQATRKRVTKLKNIKPGIPEKQGCKCCKYMKISSSGAVKEMYPSLLGTYENIKSEN